ncbi:organic cation transporter 1 [Drosophila innubila]|uniref:organic cation transporter 1 n=1 Tax=Drosophila innubila TaxID=198719 RepID=UPI00148C8A5D|nr:organic cation transporter 1 [Drosophila innubila]
MADKRWPRISCQDWIYDKTQVPYQSIATQYNWVCKNYHLAPWTVTIYFLGSIVGGLVFGYVTDHWGRIPAVMLSNFCGLVGGIMSAFSTTFLWFSITRFVVGLAFDNCCMPMYVLTWWCNDWRLLSIVTSIPIVICLLMYFFLEESARWLISVGKIDKAMSIIKKIAKVNAKTISEELIFTFEKCCKITNNEEQTNKDYTLMDLFKSCRMCLITLDLVIIWMIVALVYDAHVRAIIDIGPDIFITFSVASAVELPACLVPMFLLDCVGRKCMSLVVFIGCSTGSIIAALLKIKWQIALAALFGRFCSAITYNIGIQWAAEILPTVVRGQGLAFIHIMGFVATLLSPFVVHTKHYSPSAPMLIVGALSICAAALVLFLPETTRTDLPQTPTDTEKLSKAQRIFTFVRKIHA